LIHSFLLLKGFGRVLQALWLCQQVVTTIAEIARQLVSPSIPFLPAPCQARTGRREPLKRGENLLVGFLAKLIPRASFVVYPAVAGFQLVDAMVFAFPFLFADGARVKRMRAVIDDHP